MLVYLDANEMIERECAHEYLQEQLQLPEYYGKNLDALFDCLTEMDDTEIEIRNVSQEDTYFKRVLRVLQLAAEENPDLQIKIEMK